MKRLILAMLIVSVATACDRHSSSPIPSAPSPVALPAPPPAAPVSRVLSGYVYDTAFRAVAGVRVQVMDGPQAGTETSSDADGRFSYEATFASLVTLRATKEGYTVGTEATRVLTDGRLYAYFQLTSLSPPVPVAGNYTLTISADRACAALPDDVRTRTYPATLMAGNTRAPANTYFNGTVTGALFAPFANSFWIGVFGDYLAISTWGEGPSLVEQVGPNRYIAFSGEAGVSVGAAGISTTVSVPFKGTIEYCELKSMIGQYYDCSPALAAVREECTSNNSQLTLTRR